MPKVKNKGRILKAAREKQLVTYSGVPVRLSVNVWKETLNIEWIGKKYSKSWKAETYSQDYSIQQSYHLELKDK